MRLTTDDKHTFGELLDPLRRLPTMSSIVGSTAHRVRRRRKGPTSAVLHTAVVHAAVVHAAHHQGHHRSAGNCAEYETDTDDSRCDEDDSDRQHRNAAGDHHQAVAAAFLFPGSGGRRLDVLSRVVDHDEPRSDAGTCPRR